MVIKIRYQKQPNGHDFLCLNLMNYYLVREIKLVCREISFPAKKDSLRFCQQGYATYHKAIYQG